MFPANFPVRRRRRRSGPHLSPPLLLLAAAAARWSGADAHGDEFGTLEREIPLENSTVVWPGRFFLALEPAATVGPKAAAADAMLTTQSILDAVLDADASHAYGSAVAGGADKILEGSPCPSGVSFGESDACFVMEATFVLTPPEGGADADGAVRALGIALDAVDRAAKAGNYTTGRVAAAHVLEPDYGVPGEPREKKEQEQTSDSSIGGEKTLQVTGVVFITLICLSVLLSGSVVAVHKRRRELEDEEFSDDPVPGDCEFGLDGICKEDDENDRRAEEGMGCECDGNVVLENPPSVDIEQKFEENDGGDVKKRSGADIDQSLEEDDGLENVVILPTPPSARPMD